MATGGGVVTPWSMSLLLFMLALACENTDQTPTGRQPAEVSGTEPAASTPTAVPAPTWPPAQERTLAPEIAQAVSLLDKGDRTGALVLLETYLATTSDDPDAMQWRAAARLAEDPQAVMPAERDLARAIDLDPDYVLARVGMCDLLIPQRRCPEAMVHLDWMVAHYPDLADVWANRAFCWLATGHGPEGIADAEHACSLGHTRSCGQLPALRARQAKLDSAKLDSAKLDSAKLDSAKLDSAKLDSAKLDSAKLDSAKLDSATGAAPAAEDKGLAGQAED